MLYEYEISTHKFIRRSSSSFRFIIRKYSPLLTMQTSLFVFYLMHSIPHYHALIIQAKQRYNQRVVSGVKAFLALDARDIAAVEAFFVSQDEGGWEDFSSAGYLLANAFRTSSTKAPDNLPSVKVRRAFAAALHLVYVSGAMLLTITYRNGKHFRRMWNSSKKYWLRKMVKRSSLLTKLQRSS